MSKHHLLTVILTVASMALLTQSYTVQLNTSGGCNSGYFAGCQSSVIVTEYPYIGFSVFLLAIVAFILIVSAWRREH